MTNIFKKLQDAQFQAQITPRTQESTDWLRKKIQKMSRVDPSDVSNALQPVNTINLGSMVLFTYKADKGTIIRDKEPLFKGDTRRLSDEQKRKMSIENILHPGFYDVYPVVIIMNIYGNGGNKYLEGINLHYLAPLDRARLLDRLLPHTTNENFDVVNLYKTIGSMSKQQKGGFHPAFKKYKFTNIKSRIVQITEDEWEIATFLPLAKFETDGIRGPYGLDGTPPTKQEVYNWSKKKL